MAGLDPAIQALKAVLKLRAEPAQFKDRYSSLGGKHGERIALVNDEPLARRLRRSRSDH